MRRALQRRPGATLVECAFVYPVLFLLVLGMMVGAGGIFRYSQLASLAREGARYAVVHGGQYAQENNTTVPTPDDIFNNVIAPMAVGFDTTQMGYSITYDTTNSPYHTTFDSNNNVVPVQKHRDGDADLLLAARGVPGGHHPVEHVGHADVLLRGNHA
jgi:Flp pilus assembly protein TadG